MRALTQTARTRSVLAGTFLLHTPESFVRTPLPGLSGGEAVVHAAPALGAQFLWMTVELAAGGVLKPGRHPRFFYVVSGQGMLTVEGESRPVAAGDFALAAPSAAQTLTATTQLTAVILDKRYQPLDGTADAQTLVTGREQDVAAQPLAGDPSLQVRALIPAEPQFDFAVNTMQYAPGAALPQVEIHHMEHGLLMLEGAGLYLLGETWYPVQAGDFIWMAPFCPQQFVASSEGAKYLIYKDFNRLPEL